MNPNNGEGSRYGSGKQGSVFPKQKENVSTKVVKKLAEYGGTAVKSAGDAVKTYKDKSKINPQN
ncbi:hypothetical protein F511_22038 [Dorcoceras hygrometricum]|uniref:Uncharacterized protein n=1 Tax=Dorcoceras hygrometricum TaxID=472368 RepID=A0A2Z7A950_9LAMI|nr:hypothetical protein F511_22038 [Dorcoceras hygrometricum]